uniref:ATP synthase complex subunit 8 n=1 Tax=Satarupa nymphalis khamensis TaxID=3078212 RepID=A0AA96HSF2_9NEOP|nr:ATP synthase F0 subunit 8 [Satarupa nymphalis]UJV31581.1 ATP synthase F0 subunit 8 [Satarupa nymphalis]WNO18657.1 ATP synthase F0 subunit 8 [Satarupa nymphalis khamensis]
MPQMMPINWIISFIFFILIFIMFNIMNYYIYNIKNKNKKISKNFIYNLNWKW